MAQLGRDATVSEAEALASKINSAGFPGDVDRDTALREMLSRQIGPDLHALGQQDHPRLAFTRIREILAAHGEAAAEHQVGHYPSLSKLAEAVRSSTRLSNEAPNPEWVAARQHAAGEVFASLHTDAAIARARGSDTPAMDF